MDYQSELETTIADMVQKGRGNTQDTKTYCTAVPSINLLSGNQGPEEATANLNAINQQGHNAPCRPCISCGCTLQQIALHVWMGKAPNVPAAQQALHNMHDSITWPCLANTRPQWKMNEGHVKGSKNNGIHAG